LTISSCPDLSLISGQGADDTSRQRHLRDRPVGQVSLFSSLMTRPNKLERLSLETLSSQVLEFEGKARSNPIGAPFRCFLFLGKLLVFPANVRLDWKVIASYKHSSLFGLIDSDEGKKFLASLNTVMSLLSRLYLQILDRACQWLTL
jgi:hypothetical protein